MNAKLIALPLLSMLGLATFDAQAEEAPTATGYTARVDPAEFSDRASDSRNLGVTVSPATVRLITPGVDKFSIYNLIGAPHFDEGITRRWNYVLLFPEQPGGAGKVRCRMEIRFGRDRKDGYNITVSEIVWQEQSCADRVAAAN